MLAIEVFKILNNVTPAYIQELVQIKVTNYSFRYDNLINTPRVNIGYIQIVWTMRRLQYGTACLMNLEPSLISKISNVRSILGLAHLVYAAFANLLLIHSL